MLAGMFVGASVTVVLLGCLQSGAGEDRERKAFAAGYRRGKNLPPTRDMEVSA